MFRIFLPNIRLVYGPMQAFTTHSIHRIPRQPARASYLAAPNRTLLEHLQAPTVPILISKPEREFDAQVYVCPIAESISIYLSFEGLPVSIEPDLHTLYLHISTFITGERESVS